MALTREPRGKARSPNIQHALGQAREHFELSGKLGAFLCDAPTTMMRSQPKAKPRKAREGGVVLLRLRIRPRTFLIARKAVGCNAKLAAIETEGYKCKAQAFSNQMRV
jgi:hypothetical protein